LPGLMSCDWYAKNAATVLKQQYLPCGNILFANKRNYLEYTPVGVVSIISPWNYPFSIPFGEVVMGLMAGNAVVLKVATPTTLVGSFIEECMAAAQLPDGLFAHLVVSGAAVSKLMFQAGIDKLFFTGSVGVGKQLMKDASETLTPLSLELGGKDAMLVLEDADLERAVNCCAWACYQNAGQSCGGVERVYVHESVHDQFLKAMIAKTKALRHGPDVSHNVDVGSITTAGQLKTIQDQVNEAVRDGAKIVAQSVPTGDCSKGFFYPATVITGVTHKMRLMREETFGPVLPIIKFSTLEEGLRLANDCTMALTGSIFTSSNAKGREVATKMEAGVITINDHLYTHGAAETPWGGWKESGLGRTHGYLGLKEMSNVKCVNYDLIPASLIPRNMWWYPFDQATYDGVKNAIGFLAPQSVGQLVGSAVKLVPFALGKMLNPWIVEGADMGGTKSQSLKQKLVKFISFVAVPLGSLFVLYKKAA